MSVRCRGADRAHYLRSPLEALVPSSADAATRLGWGRTRFNRKIDNVCGKLARVGVAGLRGDSGKLATNRRARLVEHAVTSHLVTSDDLPLLDSQDGGT